MQACGEDVLPTLLPYGGQRPRLGRFPNHADGSCNAPPRIHSRYGAERPRAPYCRRLRLLPQALSRPRGAIRGRVCISVLGVALVYLV